MKIYMDTSAYVKAYHTERGSEYVNKTFEETEEGRNEIVISIWVISETINAIDIHRRRRELTDEEFRTVIGAILTDMLNLSSKEKMKIVDIETEIVKLSWEAIIGEHLSASDALHLITAMNQQVDLFLAADKSLIKAAKKKGLNAFYVENVD